MIGRVSVPTVTLANSWDSTMADRHQHHNCQPDRDREGVQSEEGFKGKGNDLWGIEFGVFNKSKCVRSSELQTPLASYVLCLEEDELIPFVFQTYGSLNGGNILRARMHAHTHTQRK